MEPRHEYKMGPWAACERCGAQTRAHLGGAPLCMVHGDRNTRAGLIAMLSGLANEMMMRHVDNLEVVALSMIKPLSTPAPVDTSPTDPDDDMRFIKVQLWKPE